MARDQGFTGHALSFDYGQRHRFELEAAKRVAEHLGAAEHRVMTIDLRAFGGSALTAEIDVPKDRASVGGDSEIPTTYVPARNTIFLAFALGFAEVIDATDIFIGVNAVDYSGYPDCRPAFIEAFETVANLATRIGVEHAAAHEPPMRIHAPLIRMSKAEIIRRGTALGVEYAMTQSCYDPNPSTGRPCRHCDACLLREGGFREAGLPDPALDR